jgi:hypothetical protein
MRLLESVTLSFGTVAALTVVAPATWHPPSALWLLLLLWLQLPGTVVLVIFY